jgi:hypothetical protein
VSPRRRESHSAFPQPHRPRSTTPTPHAQPGPHHDQKTTQNPEKRACVSQHQARRTLLSTTFPGRIQSARTRGGSQTKYDQPPLDQRPSGLKHPTKTANLFISPQPSTEGQIHLNQGELIQTNLRNTRWSTRSSRAKQPFAGPAHHRWAAPVPCHNSTLVL